MMKKNNAPSQLQDWGLLLLRITLGLSMILGHGWGKFMRLVSGVEIKFGDPIGLGTSLSFYLAMLSEALFAFLVLIGLFTRLASIPVIFTMGVVVFVVHKGMEFGDFELPFIYFFGFLSITLLGPGKFSLDEWMRKRKK